jgi:hypothetical protein
MATGIITVAVVGILAVNGLVLALAIAYSIKSTEAQASRKSR